VIATEAPFELSIPVPASLGLPNNEIIYAGTFDGVYRDMRDGSLWLMEHKTATGFPNIGFLELDDQAGSYFMAAETVLKYQGLIRDDEFLAGIMYNYLRKMMPDDRPRNAMGQALNQNGTVSKRQDTERFRRHQVWRSRSQVSKMRQRIIAEATLMMQYRNGTLPIIKTTTKDCTFCQFFEMCQLHEADEDWQEYRRAMYSIADPYSDHRELIKSAGSS
jgi:hypothetical protein